MTSLWQTGGLALCSCMIGAGQLFFKLAADKLNKAPGTSFVIGMITNGYLWIALIIYGLTTLLWVSLLRHSTLSQAYPFMALSYLIVPLIGMIAFNETLGVNYIIGTFFIISGLILIKW